MYSVTRLLGYSTVGYSTLLLKAADRDTFISELIEFSDFDFESLSEESKNEVRSRYVDILAGIGYHIAVTKNSSFATVEGTGLAVKASQEAARAVIDSRTQGVTSRLIGRQK